MRPLLYFCAIVLALPQVALASLILLIGHVAGGHTLGSLFTRLLDTVYILFTWGGLLALIALFLLFLAGFFERWRRIGAAVIAVAALASGVFLAIEGLDEVLLFLPGVIALGASGWVAISATPASACRLEAGGTAG